MPINPSKKKLENTLEKYRQKRDFRNTPEPVGGNEKDAFSFVVQEHHARSHHFDFRLEMNGVLVSWAVPKGIPEDAVAKRLAVHVEDHPLDYGSFEGVIPKGNYGAGKVAIWDKGTWQPLSENWREDFRQGKLEFRLSGKRLTGVYLLVKMREEPNWLMRKLTDEKTPKEPEKGEAQFISPQLSRAVSSVPSGVHYLHEIKLDGYRFIVVKRGKIITLFTRRGLDWTEKFPSLSKELATISDKDFVIDGEAVVTDEKGKTSFEALQCALKEDDSRIDFVVFDLLHFDGKDLKNLSLADRLKQLDAVFSSESGRIRRSRIWPAKLGAELFREACKTGLEGIMSKRADAPYRPGDRNDWAKSKCRARQEFVICGFTEPKDFRPGFGALILGSKEHGKWIERGKVGTGFSDRMREELLAEMKKLETEHSAFESPSIRNATWITPQLVAEVEFAELTREGLIRQGSFVALREDKPSEDVHLDFLAKAKDSEKNVEIYGISISHPDRMVFPADGVSKAEVASYYEAVAPWILPFVAGRPLALLRAPEGISGEMFFQKSFPQHVPKSVKNKTLGDGTEVIVIHDEKGLISLAQFGVIELHPWGAPLPESLKPDVIVWDLDPDEVVPWEEVLGAAFLLRDTLREWELEPVVKTSGGKGLHVMLFLQKRHDWETVRNFSKAVAARLAALNAQKFLIKSDKARRKGRIFIDWMRNIRGSTCVAPWSLRARPGAAISQPLNWSELSKSTSCGFTIKDYRKPPGEWKNVERCVLKKSVIFSLQAKTDSQLY